MDWVASALTWIGNAVLIKTKHWFTFVIFLVANIIWSIYWYQKGETAAFLLVLSFIGQNLWGIWSWRKKAKPLLVPVASTKLLTEMERTQENIAYAYRMTRARGVHDLTDAQINEVAERQALDLFLHDKKWQGPTY
jgi:hypothetical protein